VNVILPVAGLGTRLRPHTWSRPKPLVTVAGKTVLDHVLDRLTRTELTRVVFVTGYLGDQIEQHVRKHYDFDAVFVRQDEPRGQSHAIIQARDAVHGPTLILFPDMIFEADIEQVGGDCDGGIFVMPVDDPRRFGVVVVEDGLIRRLVEKPEQPVSDLAVMGIYYFREIQELIAAIDRQLSEDILTKGEYFLADAIQLMIEDGARIKPYQATVWEDCGTPDALLDTNRYLLKQLTEVPAREGVVVVPPAYIAPDADVRHAVIGPYASIGAKAIVEESIIVDSIVDEGAIIQSVSIERSLVGKGALIRRDPWRVNIGDASELDLSSEHGKHVH
jgi:glucose-1-phosphate thymidylyltransferase